MKKMKRLISLILVPVLLLLASCGADVAATTGRTAPAGTYAITF